MIDFVVPFSDLGDAKPQVNSTSDCQVRIIEMELSQSFTTAGSCVDDVPASVREQRGGRRHPHLGQSHQGDVHLSQQTQQAPSPAPQAKFKLEDVVRETLCLDEVPRKQCMDINIQVRSGSCKDDFSILRLTIFSLTTQSFAGFPDSA